MRRTSALTQTGRTLAAERFQAGFANRGGKGSHRNYLHEKGVALTISGKLGDDAKPYQEKLVKQKIREVK
jgi:predicted RNA binding protein YcfA (HicA-like mRNA interferase family)